MRTTAVLIASVLFALALQPAQAGPFGRGGGPGGAPGGLRLDAPYLPPGRESRGERDNAPGHGMSPGEAAQRAQAMNGGGRVLSVEPAGDGYRVKLLRDGEVRVVFVQ